MKHTSAKTKVIAEQSESSINLRDPVWFREWFKVIVRVWAQHLTLRQLGMVIFIFDRTAAWGKEWEMIRYKSFVEGVVGRDGGKIYAAGLCGSAATAQRLTTELLDMGMLRKRRSRDGNYWALNYEWKPTDMKEPRRLTRKRIPECAEMQLLKPAKVQGLKPAKVQLHKKSNTLKEEVTQKEQSPDGGGSSSITDALERAREKGRAAIERRAHRKAGKLSQLELLQIWSSSCRDSSWVEYITPREYLTKRDTFALKAYSDRFAKTFPESSFREYLKWVITQWPGLMSDLFHWMTTSPPPEAPSSLFLVRWAEKFEQAFLHNRAFSKKMDMTPEEREVSRLVKSGMDKDKAIATAYKKPMHGKHVAGGQAMSHPITQTVAIKRKPRPFSTRSKVNDDIPSFSMGDTNPYEDQ